MTTVIFCGCKTTPWLIVLFPKKPKTREQTVPEKLPQLGAPTLARRGFTKSSPLFEAVRRGSERIPQTIPLVSKDPGGPPDSRLQFQLFHQKDSPSPPERPLSQPARPIISYPATPDPLGLSLFCSTPETTEINSLEIPPDIHKKIESRRTHCPPDESDNDRPPPSAISPPYLLFPPPPPSPSPPTGHTHHDRSSSNSATPIIQETGRIRMGLRWFSSLLTQSGGRLKRSTTDGLSPSPPARQPRNTQNSRRRNYPYATMYRGRRAISPPASDLPFLATRLVRYRQPTPSL